MTQLSHTQLIELLTGGAFDELIGVEESEVVDFKQLYNKQRFGRRCRLIR